MSTRRTPQEASTARIESAARAALRKPPAGTKDEARADALLRLHQARPVSLPEPVDMPPMVNGRRLEPWEAGLYVEWAHRERRAEMVLFAGLIG